MEQAYSMLDMNVTGLAQRGVSITYTTTVGSVAASVSVMIVPDADHVNTCETPHVTIMMMILIMIMIIFLIIIAIVIIYLFIWHLDLAGRVNQQQLVLGGARGHQLQHLVEPRGEQIQAGHNS